MVDLPQFREKVTIYRKQQDDPVTGRPYTQQALAKAIGLSADELGHRLRGNGRVLLTLENVLDIVLTLAEWQAVSWEQAVKLLKLIDYPLESSGWRAKLQRFLASQYGEGDSETGDDNTVSIRSNLEELKKYVEH